MKKIFTPIAVVGVGALFAGAKNPKEYWRNIVKKRDLITDIPKSHWLIEDYFEPNPELSNKTDKIYSKRGSFIGDISFDPMEFGVPPNVVSAIDTSQLLALIVAKQVLNDVSHHQINHLNLTRTSVILGTAALEAIQYLSARIQRPIWAKALRDIGLSEDLITEACERIANSYPKWQEDSFPGLLSNVVAGRIANRFNCGGSNFTTDAACASSLAAVLAAINELQLNRADMTITGGVDTLNDLLMYKCFNVVTALSPSGRCSPFSEKADGTLLGEGIGLFALKRLSDAEANNDHIYGVIRGMGTSSDGRATSIYAPVSKEQSRAVLNAYEEAGYSIDTVELIEAHGTGTIAGDLAEYNGLLLAFKTSEKSQPQQCALGSVKSQIGHTKSAAGSAGMLKALFSLVHKILPPTLHVENVNPKFHSTDSPLYLNTETRPWVRDKKHPRRAGVSCFGFGGSNFHMTLEEYPDPKRRAKRFRLLESELVVLSEKTHQALLNKIKQLQEKSALVQGLLYIAYESQEKLLQKNTHRLAIIASDTDDLLKKLQKAMHAIEEKPPTSLCIAPDIYYGATENPPKIAFCFPRQGNEYINMGADLLMAFEPAMAVWENLTECPRLHKIVYPEPTFTKEEKITQEKRLQETRWAQPALAAASLSLINLMNALHIKADATYGEGFGEIIALHASGMIDKATLFDKAIHCDTTKIALSPSDSFSTRIKNMYAEGIRIFMQIGPAQSLSDAFKQALPNKRDYQIIYLDKPKENGVQCLWQGLAQLICSGLTPQLPVLWEDYESISAEKAAIEKSYLLQLSGTNYGKPYPSLIEKSNQFNIRNNPENTPMLKKSSEQSTSSIATEMYNAPLQSSSNNSMGLDPTMVLLAEVHNNHQNAMLQSHMEFLNVIAKMTNQAPSGQIIQNTMTTHTPTPLSFAQRMPTAPLTSSMCTPQQMPSPAAAPLSYPVFQSAEPTASSIQLPSITPKEEFKSTPTSQNVDPESIIMQVVVEKTGYPADMLHADMDIEADLGIDSIKRVEILSAIREKVPSLPEMDPSELANLKKLGDIAAYIKRQLPQQNLPQQDSLSCSSSEDTSSLRSLVLEIVVEKTGYPLEMLHEEMDIEADLGIDSIKRVEILSSIRERVPSLPEMETNDLAALKTLGDIMNYIEKNAPNAPAKKEDALKKKQSIASL